MELTLSSCPKILLASKFATNSLVGMSTIVDVQLHGRITFKSKLARIAGIVFLPEMPSGMKGARSTLSGLFCGNRSICRVYLYRTFHNCRGAASGEYRHGMQVGTVHMKVLSAPNAIRNDSDYLSWSSDVGCSRDVDNLLSGLDRSKDASVGGLCLGTLFCRERSRSDTAFGLGLNATGSAEAKLSRSIHVYCKLCSLSRRGLPESTRCLLLRAPSLFH